jgi:hypothetical protein
MISIRALMWRTAFPSARGLWLRACLYRGHGRNRDRAGRSIRAHDGLPVTHIPDRKRENPLGSGRADSIDGFSPQRDGSGPSWIARYDSHAVERRDNGWARRGRHQGRTTVRRHLRRIGFRPQQVELTGPWLLVWSDLSRSPPLVQNVAPCGLPFSPWLLNPPVYPTAASTCTSGARATSRLPAARVARFDHR